MNAIDILGSILGAKRGGGGLAGQILNDMVQGGRNSPHARGQGGSAGQIDTSPSGISREAQELEDMLNVALGNRSSGNSAPRQPQAAPNQNQTSPPWARQDMGNRGGLPAEAPDPRYPSNNPYPQQPTQRTSAPRPQIPPPANDVNQQALVLIRAMINASKCDGNISQAEQNTILQQIGDTSPETISFLRNEFSQPLDVREFAWSIPLGLEQKVYSMSLLAIERYGHAEAQYLNELAHGLRMPIDIRSQIHQRYGLPPLS